VVKVIKWLIIGWLLALVSACANLPEVAVSAQEAQQQFKGKQVAEVIQETQAALDKARAEQLDFYSPGFFAVAQQALQQAQDLLAATKQGEKSADASLLENKAEENKVWQQLLVADKSLHQAAAIKPEAQKRLHDILQVRDSLLAKGADKTAASDFQPLMGRLSDLFRRLEQNNLQGFEQDQALVLLQFKRLEAQLVKNSQLEQALAVLKQAEGLGAGGAAPKSYQKTRQALATANAVIERDPHNQQAITEAVAQFAFEADHLLHITQEVDELRELNRQALENILLTAEYRLLAISDALRQPDPRRTGIYEQTTHLVDVAKKLADAQAGNAVPAPPRPINKNELDAARARIQQLEVQLKGAQEKNGQLQRGQKPLTKRIDALERLVLNLNAEKAGLEQQVKELKAKLNKPKP
jgi:Sec-independent protein translocase protein TatA